MLPILCVIIKTQKYMPTIFIALGFRFYFWSREHEPIHVHVEKGWGEAKWDLTPNDTKRK